MAIPMTLPWPKAAGEWEVWAQMVALWMAVNYTYDDIGRPEKASRRPTRLAAIRASVASLGAFALAGLATDRIGARVTLSVSVGISVLALTLARQWMSERKRAAEWEILVNVWVVLLVAVVVAALKIVIIHPLVVFPFSKGHSGALFAAASAALFVVGGGTRIVRGVLDKSHALPPVRGGSGSSPVGESPEGRKIDVPEYNRGKTIGNIERLLMLIIVAVGSYEALGFLVAAKGLIRVKEFEDRDYVEYFIVGNLASLLVAIVVGIAAKSVVTTLWAM